MGLNGEVPHLLTSPVPSSPLLHLAGLSLPPCWLQKTTTYRDTQLWRPLEHPTPGRASLKRKVG